ncbi:g3083 [Coccomyxa viridis]|uniref:Signal recognition particle 54 kDa protein n=1 Tax=Coccomyxa viridis TaxID=1274662 RepID=A0ABP1FLY6_9CHLO
MVLNELGQRISNALAMVNNAETIDEKVLDACLKEITTALLQADVNVKLVMNLRTNVKVRANNADKGAGLNKRKIIEKSVVDELSSMLSSGLDEKQLVDLKKGKPNVVMFVGLQATGKTTTCTKYGAFYKKKGFKPALVCADTFRAGAFDQLKQNATKMQIPFYGSYTETDPAVIAAKGVDEFKKANHDLIIVDTSGRHKQEESLFEEMRQVAAQTKPDLIIFVMDGSIGQAAHDQAKAFKDTVEVGAVIMTKMDGHAKGGGALSAVAATQSPIIFIGTGEHMDEFERFEAKAFVGRLLGRGDWRGFVDKIQEAVPDDETKDDIMDSLNKGNFTMRILYEQLANVQKMGSVGQIMSMIPGLSNSGLFSKDKEKDSAARIKKFMTMMDSMTNKELDSSDIKLWQTESRIMRIARGAGVHPQYVGELIGEYVRIRTMIMGPGKGKGKGIMQQMGKMGKHGTMNPQNVQQMARMLPPQVLKQMGGPGALQGLLKQMEASGMK